MSGSVPHAISGTPQTTTHGPSLGGKRIASQRQRYTFFGSLTDGETVDTKSFTVLAGDGAATVTGGFAKWGTVDRPQRKGLTILQGYDPLTMVVPVVFECVTRDRADRLAGFANRAAQALEEDLQTLLWMAGRGLLFKGGVGGAAQGDSPLVQVLTADEQGNQTPLVPADFQTANLFWVVQEPGFDPNPLRNVDGYRIQQRATVTLTEYVGSQFGSSADSPRTRQRARGHLKGKYLTVKVTSHLRTLRELAWHYAHTTDAKDLRAIAKANPKLNQSVTAKQKIGATVRIPKAIVKHVAHS